MKTGEKAALAGLGLLGLILVSVSSKKALPVSMPLTGLPSIRRDLLQVALGQVGHVGGDLYWADVNPAFVKSHADWCGAFVLWCLHQVGLAKDRHWIMGKGFILTPPFNLPTTRDPQPGDIVYIDKPFQHQALLLSIDGKSIQTIDGNSTGGAVRVGSRLRSSVTLFYSIEPLINQVRQGQLPNA
jgi:hypothetical protein